MMIKWRAINNGDGYDPNKTLFQAKLLPAILEVLASKSGTPALL